MFSNEYRLVVKNEKKKQHRMKLNLMTRGMEEREREWKERLLKGKRATFGIVEILPFCLELRRSQTFELSNIVRFNQFPL